MRVALLVTDLQRGGTPLRIARLALGLREIGVDAHVGCLAPRGPLSDELHAGGAPTFACDAVGPRDFGAIWRLYEHIRRIRPDLIHATLTHANIAARLVGLLTRTPTLTSTATIEVERRWHLWAERLSARLDRGQIVNSETLGRHVVRAFCRPRSRVFIVPPSIARVPGRIERAAARLALGFMESEFVVLWAGRMDPVKRLDMVVRCAELLSGLPFRFVLAGDGPQRPEIEQAVRVSGAARRIDLPGWQEDVGPLLSAADAFIFPSLTEGLPNALLEALAFGLPIVASDIPPLRELAAGLHPGAAVVRGQQIMVLAASGSAAAFADVLASWRQDRAAATALGARAAAWASSRLDPAGTVRATLAVYEHVLQMR